MKKREYHIYQVIFIFTVALTLVAFFGSEGLSKWANDRMNPVARKIFSPLVSLHEFNTGSGFSMPASSLNQSFKDIREYTFLTQVDEPEVIVEDVLVADNPEPEDDEGLLVPGKISMILVGDSLAGSANARFTTVANGYDDLIFRVEGVVSANLINLGHFNWIERSAEIAQEEDWDLVMIMLGANSPQPVYVNDQKLDFNTPGWIELYKSRATEMINNYMNDGAEVWWIALPPMRKEGYKDRILSVNSIIAEVCEETGATQVSIDEVFGDENGQYTHYKVVDGKQVALRTDGIHYSFSGAQLLSEFLIEKVRTHFAFESLEMMEATRINDEQEQLRLELLYN